MLQAEIMVTTSGQTAACRRTYSSTFAGFSPSTMPMRCIDLLLAGNHARELGDTLAGNRIPVPVDADARLAGRDGETVLDLHAAACDLVELRNVLDIAAVLHRASQADVQ